MKLRIVTPERIVLEEDVEAVYAQTIDGEVGILPQHIPLVSPLGVGVLRYVKANQKVPVAVMGGLLRTNGNEVSILSNAAEQVADIDTARANAAKARAEKRLQEKADEVDATRAQLALSRAILRLKLSS